MGPMTHTVLAGMDALLSGLVCFGGQSLVQSPRIPLKVQGGGRGTLRPGGRLEGGPGAALGELCARRGVRAVRVPRVLRVAKSISHRSESPGF